MWNRGLSPFPSNQQKVAVTSSHRQLSKETTETAYSHNVGMCQILFKRLDGCGQLQLKLYNWASLKVSLGEDPSTLRGISAAAGV